MLTECNECLTYWNVATTLHHEAAPSRVHRNELAWTVARLWPAWTEFNTPQRRYDLSSCVRKQENNWRRPTAYPVDAGIPFSGRARSDIVFAVEKTQVYWPHTHLSPSSLRWRTFMWSPQIPPAPSLWMSELKLMRIPAHMWMNVVRWRTSPQRARPRKWLTCEPGLRPRSHRDRQIYET
jgi:hypothetical protein